LLEIVRRPARATLCVESAHLQCIPNARTSRPRDTPPAASACAPCRPPRPGSAFPHET